MDSVRGMVGFLPPLTCLLSFILFLLLLLMTDNPCTRKLPCDAEIEEMSLFATYEQD